MEYSRFYLLFLWSTVDGIGLRDLRVAGRGCEDLPMGSGNQLWPKGRSEDVFAITWVRVRRPEMGRPKARESEGIYGKAQKARADQDCGRGLRQVFQQAEAVRPGLTGFIPASFGKTY